jgi:hypothetical protein
MSERTTVRLPAELVTRAKRKATAEGRTLTALIEEGLRRVVAETKQPASPRITPRVSKAKPGLMPGIDLDDLSPLQDIADRDYVRPTGRAP